MKIWKRQYRNYLRILITMKLSRTIQKKKSQVTNSWDLNSNTKTKNYKVLSSTARTLSPTPSTNTYKKPKINKK